MPIEIRELIVKAVVSNEDIQRHEKPSAGSSIQMHSIEAVLEQLKKMMSDSKER
ncbi:MAG: DUF5908 family protein [Bacteroidia bacterium]|jgi:hypothetical protein|nr:DUF5908 family protein [Bacteroidia bacterium]